MAGIWKDGVFEILAPLELGKEEKGGERRMKTAEFSMRDSQTKTYYRKGEFRLSPNGGQRKST